MNKPGLKNFLMACAGMLACWAALAQPSPAAAEPAMAMRGLQYPADLVMDTSGRQSLAEIEGRFAAGESRPVSGTDSLPLGGDHTAWLRIHLPDVPATTESVLTVVHPDMDSVVLYQPMPGRQWKQQLSGDMLPVAQWAMPYLHPTFPVVMQPGETRPLYLAVKHSTKIGIYWQLWDRASFDRQSSTLHMVLGGYLGFVVLVIILSCFNAWNWRDPIHLIYAIYVVILGLGQLSLTGLAGEYVWPHQAWWNDIAAVVLPMFAAGWAALLLHRLMVERGHRLAGGLLVSVMVVSLVLTLAFLVLGRYRVFFVSNLAYLYIAPVLLGTLAWFSFRRPLIGLWALAGFACLTVGSFFPILRNLNLVPINFYTQFGAQIGAALEIPMLLVALYFRSRERRDTQVRLGALARVDPLTGVVSHRLLMERLEHLLQRHQRDPQVGAVIRVRLVNGLQLRTAYGPVMAQAALVRAGACVALPAQVSDTVGRHSDGDFVLLMEGKAGETEVNDVAQHIIAEGLRPDRKLPPDLVLQLHVACADCTMLGDTRDGGEALLQRLGGLLDHIAANPPKTLRFLKLRPDPGPGWATEPPASV
ncbi:MAG: 7TM diverse intracellular signaling domain-containing protein [Polaromonas sp.]|nr:7TM diverse intracellular signaling domain-containing protein [Polaromonas sp.]